MSDDLQMSMHQHQLHMLQQQQQHNNQNNNNNDLNSNPLYHSNALRNIISSNAAQIAAAAATTVSVAHHQQQMHEQQMQQMHQQQQQHNHHQSQQHQHHHHHQQAQMHPPEVKVHAAVRMFEQWHRTHIYHSATYQPLSSLPINSLLQIIGEWISVVKKAHGGEYTADTLYVYLSSIQRHIRVTHQIPGFNLLECEPVRIAMEAKYGRDAVATLLNRGNTVGGGCGGAQKSMRTMEDIYTMRASEQQNKKRKLAHEKEIALNEVEAINDMYNFKQVKPSHRCRTFQTEHRLLTARQDPSTPEGLLRCLLWVILTHVSSLNKSTCWNLTANQFQVLTAVTDPSSSSSEQKKSENVRYLQYQPTRKVRAGDTQQRPEATPTIMYEQPGNPHVCPVYLFTEFLRHRPARTNPPSYGGNPIVDGEDQTHLWLLTKKTIETIGENAGMWYASRRIGMGTMEKLITVTRNERNAPVPTTGDPLAERAAKLAIDDASDGEEPQDMDQGGDQGDNDSTGDECPVKRREREQAAAAAAAASSSPGASTFYPIESDDESSKRQKTKQRDAVTVMAAAGNVWQTVAAAQQPLYPKLRGHITTGKKGAKQAQQQAVAAAATIAAAASSALPNLLPNSQFPFHLFPSHLLSPAGPLQLPSAASSNNSGSSSSSQQQQQQQLAPPPPQFSNAAELEQYLHTFSIQLQQMRNSVEMMERHLEEVTRQVKENHQQQQQQHQQQQLMQQQQQHMLDPPQTPILLHPPSHLM